MNSLRKQKASQKKKNNPVRQDDVSLKKITQFVEAMSEIINQTKAKNSGELSVDRITAIAQIAGRQIMMMGYLVCAGLDPASASIELLKSGLFDENVQFNARMIEELGLRAASMQKARRFLYKLKRLGTISGKEFGLGGGYPTICKYLLNRQYSTLDFAAHLVQEALSLKTKPTREQIAKVESNVDRLYERVIVAGKEAAATDNHIVKFDRINLNAMLNIAQLDSVSVTNPVIPDSDHLLKLCVLHSKESMEVKEKGKLKRKSDSIWAVSGGIPSLGKKGR